MEKHIEIFCKQNPETKIKCPACHKEIKIETKEFLKNKNIYKGTCEYCGNNISYDTTDMFEKLKFLKKFC